MNSIVSYGQASDTVKCYNITELRKIATQITQKQECDTLLGLANYRMIVQDSIIYGYREQVALFKSLSSWKDSTINTQHVKIAGLEKSLKQTKNYTLWGSIGLILVLLLIK